MKNIYFLFFTFFSFSIVNAQNTFEKVIDTLGSAGALCIQETFDGGYVYCGTSTYNGNDAMIVKLDSIGTIEWAKIYSGPGLEGAMFMEQTPDSGYIVNAVYDGGLNTKSWLLRLDVNGDTLWTKTFSVGTGSTTIDHGNSMATVNNILYGLTGYVSPQPVVCPYLITCLSNGFLMSSKIYNHSPYGSTGSAVCNTFDNGFAITGQFGVAPTDADVHLTRTDSFGDTLWVKTYSRSSQGDVGVDVKQTADSGFIVAGYTFNTSANAYNIYLIKTDSVGDTLWTKSYYSSDGQGPFSIQQTDDEGYIIVGNAPNGTFLNDIYLIKTDANGDTLWTRFFGDVANDHGYFVRQTKDGGYIICGIGGVLGTAGTYLIKTDSLGNVPTGLNVPEVNNPFGFTVLPNPCSGIFTVRLNGLPQGNSSLEIYNLNNQCIYACNVKINSTEHINFSKMPGGMYVVMLRMKEEVISKKIIIQK